VWGLAMLSYARGVEEPILEKTIHQVLDEAAERLPDQEAVVSRHQGVRLTYRQLQQESLRVARGLWGLGIRPRDRIGMWSTSCVEWIYLQTAVARLGAVLVNLNPAYRVLDLRHILGRSGVQALFLHEEDHRADYAGVLRDALERQDLPQFHTILLDSDDWERIIEGGADFPEIPVSPQEVVNIQYTSGTTGSPKGVLLTNRNLVNDGLFIGQRLKASGRDRICTPVPLYHCFGCVIGAMVALTSGAALVLPAAQFDALAVLEAVEEERCTALYGVPTMFIAEFEHPRFARFDLSSLRTGVMAGAPCPIELMRRVVHEMHCSELTICYGQTESSPVIVMSATDDSVETRVTTVGSPLPDTEIRLADLETGQTVPVGEQGELCVRGFAVMKGYDENPEATARAIDAEGWLHSGDLATMRPDGYFRITGRAKDMISRGGEKVYPLEVEEFLRRHPNISDVYVFGIPDERLGERVAAWVRLRSRDSVEPEAIRNFCRGQIAYFKIPEHVRFVDAFPMTANGKVQKYLMRSFEVQALGLEAATETA